MWVFVCVHKNRQNREPLVNHFSIVLIAVRNSTDNLTEIFGYL